MKSESPSLLTRRGFIRQAACAAVGTTAISNTLLDLRLINSLVAAAPVTDYKALVCVFLYGGNDANNLIIPRSGTDYDAYAAARLNLAIPAASLLPIDPASAGGREYGFHPSCGGLQQLFNGGQAAVMANVGTLVEPVTRAQYQAKTRRLPPQLFSHNDQQVQWQTSIPDRPMKTGWGGRCADLLYSLNEGSQVSMSISVAGVNTWEVGDIVQQYHVSAPATASSLDVSIGLQSIGTTQLQAMRGILDLAYPNLFEQEFATVVDRAIDNNALIRAALTAATPLVTTFPNESLSNQLRSVARLISVRQALNMKRQIFFVSKGGFDTHGEQNATHATLLGQVSTAMKAFYDATAELGIADKVTAFTASDFGRTLPSNGQGSDHGWGSHQIVVGGAVNADMYGAFPTLAVNGPDDTSTGRWIPTTAVDQYAATLARWFGVNESNLPDVFPNIGRFATSNLGFLTAS